MAEALAREQLAAGLEVWLLFLYGPPGLVSAQFPGWAVCLGLRSSIQAFRGIPSLRKAIRRIAPDIIHSHDGITWPRLALLRLGIPLMMHSHLPAWHPRNLRERMGWLLIRRTTDILIGISPPTIDSWLGAGFPRFRIRYVPNGVDLDRFNFVAPDGKITLRQKLGLPSNKKILLWVGRLHRSMKGSDRIEHIARLLPDDTVLAVVGNGPEFRGMVDRCADLVKAGRMFMVGSVDSPEVYYKAADAFLFTSYHEPFGLVILEAVASGLPILSFPLTKGGGAAALLEEFGAVEIPDGAPAERIREALGLLFAKGENRAGLRRLAESGYSWKGLSRKVVEVYDSVLELRTSSALRILHICQRDDLSTGGATRIAFDLVVGQRSCGADSHLLFLYGEPAELGSRLPWECTHYLHLASASEVVFKGWRMKRKIRRFRPDVVHHHDMLSWPQFMHLPVHAYSIVYHAHLDYRPPSTLKAWLAWWVVRANADVLITPSRHGRQCLLDAGIPDGQVAVVPNGTRSLQDVAETSPERGYIHQKHRLETDCVLLGWAGRLHCATKGADDFVRLFAHLPEKFVGIIAGEGPDRGMLEQLVKECGLQRRIFFHGLEQEMPRFYCDLDAFVLTSHFESFGLVVIEALTNCVPVFSFPVEGGIADLLQLPAVAVASSRSIEAMGRLIQEAFADQDSMEKAVCAARREVEERYSIDRMASETISLYKRLVEK